SRKSRSTRFRRARSIPAAWRFASRASNAIAPTRAPPKPTPSRPSSRCTSRAPARPRPSGDTIRRSTGGRESFRELAPAVDIARHRHTTDCMAETIPDPLLARTISLTQATAMVVGTIVGSSIFVQPSEVSRAVPSFGGMLLVWIAAGALTWFGASICAELSAAMPRTGGVYVFLREMFSPAAGFLWGWAMFWSMHSGIIAAIAMVFGRYFATILPLGDLGIRLVAVAGILVLSAINYLGVRPGSSVQTALTIAKLAPIGVLLVLLFSLGTPQMPAALGGVEPRSFLRALVAGLFAFGGWHMVTYAAEETREPERTIPRALMIGTAVVVVTYLALNSAYLLVLPIDRVLASTHIAFDATAATAGPA